MKRSRLSPIGFPCWFISHFHFYNYKIILVFVLEWANGTNWLMSSDRDYPNWIPFISIILSVLYSYWKRKKIIRTFRQIHLNNYRYKRRQYRTNLFYLFLLLLWLFFFPRKILEHLWILRFIFQNFIRTFQHNFIFGVHSRVSY